MGQMQSDVGEFIRTLLQSGRTIDEALCYEAMGQLEEGKDLKKRE